MSTPSLLIFVQRKNGEGDDVIRVSRSTIDTSRYRVSYADETVKMTPREMYLTESEVLEYMITVMDTLMLDKDPFEYFQITPPAAPAVQFDIADLQKPSVRQAILSSITFTLRHWTVQEIPVRRAALNREDSDEEFRTPPARRRRLSSSGRSRPMY